METDFHILGAGDKDFFMGFSQFNGQVGHPLPLAYVVLLICQQGSAELDVNFQPYRMKKNDFFVLAEDSIALINSKSDDFSCTYYLMNRSIAAEVANGLPNSLFSFLHKFPFFASETYCLPFMKAWESLSERIEEQRLRYKRTIIVNHFQNIFLWISQNIDDVDACVKNDYSRQEAICWQFWELISAHCRQEREVAFYANVLHITPYYLSQLTRKFFNDAPKTLIDRQVVLEIKKQLAQSKKSIQQIADDLHFADASYLGKYFKRHTGAGLTEYRKSRS